MTLAAGTKLGPYEILAPIGAGGMGQVHFASDLKFRRVPTSTFAAPKDGDMDRERVEEARRKLES